MLPRVRIISCLGYRHHADILRAVAMLLFSNIAFLTIKLTNSMTLKPSRETYQEIPYICGI
jgi:hypothetical protein